MFETQSDCAERGVLGFLTRAGALVALLGEREIVDCVCECVCVSGSLVFPEGVSSYRQSGTTLGPSAVQPTD